MIDRTDVRESYLGDGTTTAFAFDQPFDTDSELVVYLEADSGHVLQTLGTDYTVSGAGSSTGGTVTFTTAPENLKRVTIWRVTPDTQLRELGYRQAVDTQELEDALDKTTRIAQEVRYNLTRVLRSPYTDLIGLSELPDIDDRKGKYLGFDDDGNPVAATAAEIAADNDLNSDTLATLQHRAASVVTPDEYGAEGNGVTSQTDPQFHSDSDAINNALTAARASGAIVRFNTGKTYVVTEPILLQDNDHLQIYGTIKVADNLDYRDPTGNTRRGEPFMMIRNKTSRLYNEHYGIRIDGGMTGVLDLNFDNQITTSDLPEPDRSTAFVAGDVVVNASNVYLCLTGGTTSASAGDKPTGTDTAVSETDGTVVWRYRGAVNAEKVIGNFAGIVLRGNDNVVSGLKVKGFGGGYSVDSTSTRELFVVMLFGAYATADLATEFTDRRDEYGRVKGRGNYAYEVEITESGSASLMGREADSDDQLVSCFYVAENQADGNTTSTTSSKGTVANCYVHNLGLWKSGEDESTKVAGHFAVQRTHGVTADRMLNCYIEGVTCGYYKDSWSQDHCYCVGNNFVNVQSAIFLNPHILDGYIGGAYIGQNSGRMLMPAAQGDYAYSAIRLGSDSSGSSGPQVEEVTVTAGSFPQCTVETTTTGIEFFDQFDVGKQVVFRTGHRGIISAVADGENATIQSEWAYQLDGETVDLAIAPLQRIEITGNNFRPQDTSSRGYGLTIRGGTQTEYGMIAAGLRLHDNDWSGYGETYQYAIEMRPDGSLDDLLHHVDDISFKELLRNKYEAVWNFSLAAATYPAAGWFRVLSQDRHAISGTTYSMDIMAGKLRIGVYQGEAKTADFADGSQYAQYIEIDFIWDPSDDSFNYRSNNFNTAASGLVSNVRFVKDTTNHEAFIDIYVADTEDSKVYVEFEDAVAWFRGRRKFHHAPFEADLIPAAPKTVSVNHPFVDGFSTSASDSVAAVVVESESTNNTIKDALMLPKGPVVENGVRSYGNSTRLHFEPDTQYENFKDRAYTILASIRVTTQLEFPILVKGTPSTKGSGGIWLYVEAGGLEADDTRTVKLHIAKGTTDQEYQSESAIPVGKIVHVALVQGSPLTEDPVLYVNGDVVAWQSSENGTGATSSDASSNIYLFAWDNATKGCELFSCTVINYDLSRAEVLESMHHPHVGHPDVGSMVKLESGDTMVRGRQYEIVSRTTLNFTSHGSPDNSTGTRFYCINDTGTLGASDEVYQLGKVFNAHLTSGMGLPIWDEVTRRNGYTDSIITAIKQYTPMRDNLYCAMPFKGISISGDDGSSAQWEWGNPEGDTSSNGIGGVLPDGFIPVATLLRITTQTNINAVKVYADSSDNISGTISISALNANNGGQIELPLGSQAVYHDDPAGAIQSGLLFYWNTGGGGAFSLTAEGVLIGMSLNHSQTR